jgi:phospholipase/carboxylesterase
MTPIPDFTNTTGVTWAGPDSPAYAAAGLVHTVYAPPLTAPAPTAVLLHGWGGNEQTMWLFKQSLPPEVVIVAPRAPLALASGGYGWFYRDDPLHLSDPDSLLAAVAKVERFLTALPQIYPVDPARLLLIGFSQGAAVSNSLVMARPELVKGVALLAGMGFELPELILPAMSLAGLTVFIAHGIRDEIVPLHAAQQARQIYERLGARVTYGEYNVGHKVHVRGMKDLQRWARQVLEK